MAQGLTPRTRVLRWVLFLLAILIVVSSVGSQALESASGWLADEYERLPWYVTRITALLAYLALTGSVVYGLLLSTKILDRIAQRTVSFTLHQDLSSIGVALALVHVAVLMIDRTMPYSLSQVILPFGGPYRPLWVGIGQLTLILSLLVLFSFYARRRLGQKTWRRLHYLSFVIFLGATIHGLMSGTDTASSRVYALYLVSGSSVAFLVIYRVVLAIGGRSTGAHGAMAGTGRSATIPSAARAAGVVATGMADQRGVTGTMTGPSKRRPEPQAAATRLSGVPPSTASRPATD